MHHHRFLPRIAYRWCGPLARAIAAPALALVGYRPVTVRRGIMCFPMRVKLVRIGNSRGVLIPKAVLDQLGLEGELDLV